jgi:hypothetical protein
MLTARVAGMHVRMRYFIEKGQEASISFGTGRNHKKQRVWGWKY